MGLLSNETSFSVKQIKRLGELSLEKLDARIIKLEQRLDAIDLEIKENTKFIKQLLETFK